MAGKGPANVSYYDAVFLWRFQLAVFHGALSLPSLASPTFLLLSQRTQICRAARKRLFILP